jgi:acyl phosphate:glycerol-3-phosphate acyltransferase
MLTALAAYLLGSIPTGYLVAKAKGIDIRAAGSGNIGATNAMRVLGKPIGVAVLLLDMVKGFGAVCLGISVVVFFTNLKSEPNRYNELVEQFALIAGICAVLGHNYTCWLKFKGGKGIATTAGVYLALAPWALLVALAVFVLAVALTRYVSIGSISAALALPVTVWLMSPDNLMLGIITTTLGALAIYRHQTNIRRLIAGTENRLSNKPKPLEEKK